MTNFQFQPFEFLFNPTGKAPPTRGRSVFKKKEKKRKKHFRCGAGIERAPGARQAVAWGSRSARCNFPCAPPTPAAGRGRLADLRCALRYRILLPNFKKIWKAGIRLYGNRVLQLILQHLSRSTISHYMITHLHRSKLKISADMRQYRRILRWVGLC